MLNIAETSKRISLLKNQNNESPFHMLEVSVIDISNQLHGADQDGRPLF